MLDPKYAINKLGDAFAKSGASFASDDDPDLIEDAVPFSLKLIEGLLAESPRHRGLLFAASSGFTQYSYAFVHQKADELEDRDLARATALRRRARRLYLRARNYGLCGLEAGHRGFEKALRENPKAAVRVASAADASLLYWTAASWGAAISLSKDDPELIADQPIVEALIDRALELDESLDHGAIHGFLIAYEAAFGMLHSGGRFTVLGAKAPPSPARCRAGHSALSAVACEASSFAQFRETPHPRCRIHFSRFLALVLSSVAFGG